MSTRQAIIETSFAKESGYGNSVFSKVASARNGDHINELFGAKKEFEPLDVSFHDPPSMQASRDVLMQDSEMGATTDRKGTEQKKPP